MKILLIAEHDNQKLKNANFHTLNAAQQLQGDIDILIAGYQCDAVVDEAKKLPHVKKILLADAPEYSHQLAENTASLIVTLAHQYQYIMISASETGKNCLPRVAALLDIAMVSDVITIISPNTFERYMYAGNALATLSIEEPIKLITIRQTAFAALAPVENNSAPTAKINEIILNKLTSFVSQELTQTTRPELTDAKIIVSGGRGIKSADNFKLLEQLADKLGAAVGASRAAVDAGFAPNDYQVGQTGKVVAPDLYMAFGISGAIQHLAGMKDSKVVVAINSDPEAPIFAVADYGLVADLFDVLVEMGSLIKDK